VVKLFESINQIDLSKGTWIDNIVLKIQYSECRKRQEHTQPIWLQVSLPLSLQIGRTRLFPFTSAFRRTKMNWEKWVLCMASVKLR
jgi:hypothetical protein